MQKGDIVIVDGYGDWIHGSVRPTGIILYEVVAVGEGFDAITCKMLSSKENKFTMFASRMIRFATPVEIVAHKKANVRV
jgi:hypothetical protein